MKGIKIIQNNKEDILLAFKSKIELKTNDFYQDILKKYQKNLKEQGASIKCLCNDVDMSCRTTSYNYLSNMPNNSYKHLENCIYFDHLENTTDKDDKYRDIIFAAPVLNFKTATNEKKIEFNKKDNHRNNTYVNFCTDMISESMIRSFNIKNKNVNCRENIIYPNYEEFLQSFESLMGDNNFLQTGSVKKSLPEYHTFCYGILNYDFITQLETRQKEYDIFLPTRIKTYDHNNKFIGFDIKNINCKIGFHTLKAATELVKNFTNYIAFPYFFMAVYKNNINNKKIVRLYLHPIYFDNSNIVFVDSGYERKYAEKLITDKTPFLKPIKDSCFYKINGKFVNYLNPNNEEKRAFLQYLPDFIEFEKEHIQIVEVSGYDNVEYQNQMNRKIKHYNHETTKSSGLYAVKVVDGKKL